MARPTRSPERSGPHDADDVHADLSDAPGIVDFGAVRVPVPERGMITVEPGENGRMQAVHVSLPEGRLSVSALAAPKSSRLWPDLATEIDASLREGGARVRSFQGEWGRELHATSGAATSVFVGVDGARWMLYGVATGPTRDAAPLLEELRHMVRGTIVARGRAPYPVRTVLPLEPPGHLVEDASDPAIAATPTVVVRAVPDGDGGHGPTVAPAADPSGPTSTVPVNGSHVGPVEPAWAAPVHPAPAAGPRPSTGRVRPAAGPGRAPGAVRDPDDRPTDVWPDGLLPGSRGHGPSQPATPPDGGRRRATVPRGFGEGHRPAPASRGSLDAVVPEVLRRGRHAAPESQDAGPPPRRGGWSGVAPGSGPGGPTSTPVSPAFGPPAVAAPWVAAGPGPAGAPDDTDPVTEPLPLIRPAPRPSGRHRRRD